MSEQFIKISVTNDTLVSMSEEAIKDHLLVEFKLAVNDLMKIRSEMMQKN